jgi:hypothetical protein
MMQQFRHGLDLIRNLCRHRRCAPATFLCPKTATCCTEVIQCPNQIDAPLDRCRAPGQDLRAPAEDHQPTAKGSVQPLDIRDVQYLNIGPYSAAISGTAARGLAQAYGSCR